MSGAPLSSPEVLNSSIKSISSSFSLKTLIQFQLDQKMKYPCFIIMNSCEVLSSYSFGSDGSIDFISKFEGSGSGMCIGLLLQILLI